MLWYYDRKAHTWDYGLSDIHVRGNAETQSLKYYQHNSKQSNEISNESTFIHYISKMITNVRVIWIVIWLTEPVFWQWPVRTYSHSRGVFRMITTMNWQAWCKQQQDKVTMVNRLQESRLPVNKWSWIEFAYTFSLCVWKSGVLAHTIYSFYVVFSTCTMEPQ